MTQPTQRDPRQPFGTRDPRQPFGTPPPPPVSIQTYQAPKNRAPWIVAAVATVIIATLAVSLFLIKPGTSAPTPTPTPAKSPIATAGSDRGSPWEMRNGAAAGYWEIMGEEWTGSTVTLDVQIECSAGSLTWDLISYPNTGNNALDPDSPTREPSIAEGRCTTGEKVRGFVSFTYSSRGPATLILATRFDAISGLKIKG